MAAPANLVTTANTVGNREDLSDVIHRVAPEKTPLISNIGKGKAQARYTEWQTETLASPDAANAQLEGDDVTLQAGNQPARVGNWNQIFNKVGGVSRTQEIVDTAGRASEIARQKAIKGIELRRDIEARAIGNYASNAESGGTPRRMAGLLAWLTSNAAVGSTGANGGFSGTVVAAATNGTQRTFSEALVKSVQATAFANGAAPSQAYMGGTHKQQFSAFTGIAQIRKETPGQKLATIVGGADVYVGDFGTLTLIPHPYGLTRDCVLVDPDMAELAMLDGYKTEALAKTGDNERFLMTAEATLRVKNEKAHAVIRDLT